MDNFNQLSTTILGNEAEDLLITEFALSNNVKSYRPSYSASFPVDSLCLFKNKVYGLEIKAKPRMVKYEYTGFDKKDYITYNNLDFPVYVLFADSKEQSIYGVWCHELKEQPSKEFGEVIVFPLTAMTYYRGMTTQEVDRFQELGNSNYK